MGMPIQKTEIVGFEDDTDAALRAIGLTRDVVVRVARAAATAKADTLPIDALSAPGSMAYFAGVREIRLNLLPIDGWRVSRLQNIESTINDDLGVQLCFQNVDFACNDTRQPHALSSRGRGSRELIAAGQGELFELPHSKTGSFLGKLPEVWVICVAATERALQVEVSCPKVFEGDQFEGFHRRIYVLDEPYESAVPVAPVDDGEFAEPEIKVSKKQQQ